MALNLPWPFAKDSNNLPRHGAMQKYTAGGARGATAKCSSRAWGGPGPVFPSQKHPGQWFAEAMWGVAGRGHAWGCPTYRRPCKFIAVLVDLFCQTKSAITSTSNDMHRKPAEY